MPRWSYSLHRSAGDGSAPCKALVSEAGLPSVSRGERDSTQENRRYGSPAPIKLVRDISPRGAAKRTSFRMRKPHLLLSRACLPAFGGIRDPGFRTRKMRRRRNVIPRRQKKLADKSEVEDFDATTVVVADADDATGAHDGVFDDTDDFLESLRAGRSGELVGLPEKRHG